MLETLLRKMNERSKLIPKTWEEKYITLIYEERNDLEKPLSYRPISIPEYMKRITEIIHTDQTCYIPKRKMKDNSRFRINALECMDNKKKEYS